MPNWNPWHGCHKISSGCKHCYVYRQDFKFEKDSSIVTKNADFDLPIKKRRNREYKIPSGEILYTCFTSDFFLYDADEWRIDAWKMIKERKDLKFFIVTKRIDRFFVNLPVDWESGYDNVIIACTVENQERADYRLPIFLKLPIKHKIIIVSPLLENINLSKYLNKSIEEVAVGGESGLNARVCDYDWVLNIREQCIKANIPFWFQQTGMYLKKDGKVYKIDRKYQHAQARKADINYMTDKLKININGDENENKS